MRERAVGPFPGLAPAPHPSEAQSKEGAKEKEGRGAGEDKRRTCRVSECAGLPFLLFSSRVLKEAGRRRAGGEEWERARREGLAEREGVGKWFLLANAGRPAWLGPLGKGKPLRGATGSDR